ncbi:ComEC/Rec2 family competence protein [Petroclostridium xylanilyticum]|uniref:ComEC/Rec2 family competence protein n=1 Tax=Petroclostridium xylanilyticum TaxID=1792311 RepID=UPI000B982FE3|nr:ComEC/Rec2 family competence protein [Petroclostridium xylanilyticum]
MKLKKLSIICLIFILTFVTAACTITTSDTEKKQDPDALKIHFIDVGQGDSILVNLPQKFTMLIDAGNNNDGEKIVRYIKDQGIKRIDYIVGTHPHEDHIGALDVVIQTFDIGKVYMPKVSHNTKTFKDVLLAVKEKGLKVSSPKPGEIIFDKEDLKVQFLAPNAEKYEELNNYSIVTKVTYGETSFLLTGDAEDVSEKEMLEKFGTGLKANVLKLGHHGSTSSTTPEFLKAVSPEYAVISVGKDNTYGHPHKETIGRLNKKGIKIYRTDKNGTVVMSSDGQEISVWVEKEN